jgi:pimeloyl-ACP methyl ester carboxylesterase
LKRRWKVLIGFLVALAVLLAVNTLVLESQTKEAEVTVEGGQILHLSSGDVQVADTGESAVPAGQGSGQPIVLIHGYAGSLHWFDKLVPLLSKDHRVIRIDLLGFGGSEKPESGYGIEEQARIVAEALHKLDVSGAMVVGHSLGAAVTASLAEQASELVDRAVVIDEAPDESSKYGYDPPLLQDLTYEPVLGEALWRVTPDFEVRDALKIAFAPGFDFGAGFDDSDQPVKDFRQMTYSSYEDAYAGAKDFVGQTPLNERFTAASVPLMVLFGSEDQIFDATASIAGYDGVPGVETATIQGAGHSPQVERPQQVAAKLEGFATKIPAVRPPSKPKPRSPGSGKSQHRAESKPNKGANSARRPKPGDAKTRAPGPAPRSIAARRSARAARRRTASRGELGRRRRDRLTTPGDRGREVVRDARAEGEGQGLRPVAFGGRPGRLDGRHARA